jgi:hypothetical protein
MRRSHLGRHALGDMDRGSALEEDRVPSAGTMLYRAKALSAHADMAPVPVA